MDAGFMQRYGKVRPSLAKKITFRAPSNTYLKYTANMYSFCCVPLSTVCNLTGRFTLNCLIQSNVEVTVKKLQISFIIIQLCLEQQLNINPSVRLQ